MLGRERRVNAADLAVRGLTLTHRMEKVRRTMSLRTLPDQIVRRFRRTKTRWTWVLRCKLARRKAIQSGKVSPGRILLHPEGAPISSAFYKLSHYAGLEMVAGSRGGEAVFDFVMFYQDATVREPDAVIERLALVGPVVNYRMRDIGKQRLQQAFESYFGYQLAIDPTTHTGPAVRKSNENAAHDGQIVQCPIRTDQVDPVSVYQRLIDTSTSLQGEAMVLDHRVSIMGDQMPVCYKKYRPVGDRFSNRNSYAEMVEPRECFSGDEMAMILGFCQQEGLDYAELDVLRDKSDGRIYVVDVNPTPAGPPNHLRPDQVVDAVIKLADGWTKGMSGFRRKGK